MVGLRHHGRTRSPRPSAPSASSAGPSSAGPSSAALSSRRSLPGSRLQRARRARLRRWGAAGLAGSAVALGLSALRPAATDAGLPTVVAVRAIAAGAVISASDVHVENRPAEHRPESAAADIAAVVGRRAAAPIEARGMLTGERLAGAGLLAGRSDDRAAMTVPVMDIALTGVEAGGRVDLYATGTGEQVVAGAQVLAVLGGQAGNASGSGADSQGKQAAAGPMTTQVPWGDGADPGITVAVSAAEARLLATHLSTLSAGESFAVAVRPEP